jgi:hypothetical protein
MGAEEVPVAGSRARGAPGTSAAAAWTRRGSPSSGGGAHVRLGVGVGHTGRLAEVLDGLALALGAAQQHAVLAGGGGQGQLVKGQALAAGLRACVCACSWWGGWRDWGWQGVCVWVVVVVVGAAWAACA